MGIGDLGGGVEPPARNCTCLRMIHQGAAVAAPISDFASCEVTFNLFLIVVLSISVCASLCVYFLTSVLLSCKCSIEY